MSSSPAVKDYINNLAINHTNEEIRGIYAQMRDFYDKKLWHQLTIKLEELVNLPYFDKGDELVHLYSNFIKDFEKKMNQLTLVRVALRILRQITDLAQSAEFLNVLLNKLNQASDREAYSLCQSEIAWIKLRQGNLDEAKTIYEKVQGILEGITGADPTVYSSFYRGWAMYYKVKVQPTEFYRNSLLYLVYTPIESINVADQQAIAFDMGIAALVSKDIHNFGELLSQPVLLSLNGTKAEWLKNFLFAFNSGNIDKFNQFLVQNKSDIEQQAALKANFPLLREKISILALMELVFARPTESRVLPFKEVGDAVKLPADEVELLVMKALSLKLIRGSIDQVNETVSIWWVQPRVLDLGQIGKMKERLGNWISSVNQLETFMQNETATELLS